MIMNMNMIIITIMTTNIITIMTMIMNTDITMITTMIMNITTTARSGISGRSSTVLRFPKP